MGISRFAEMRRVKDRKGEPNKCSEAWLIRNTAWRFIPVSLDVQLLVFFE